MAAKFHEETVTVNGRKYTLQHPGVPAWMKKRQEIAVIQPNGRMLFDMYSLIEYAFEHVVVPHKGAKLKLDNWDPTDQAEIEEVWQPLVLNFLRGQKLVRNHASKDWREANPEEWEAMEAANLPDAGQAGTEEEPQEGSGGRPKEPSDKDADRRDRQGGHQQRTPVSDRGD